MPRRMPLGHDELRTRAVAIARDLVAAEGLPGLTVRRLATGLGCAVGSVYNLFLDLDDVVLHVAASVVDDMSEALFAPGLPEAPEARLVELARRYIRFAASEGRLWAMVFEHEPTHLRPTPAWQTDRIARLVERVRAEAVPALADAAAAAEAVDLLWASVHGIAALAQKGKLGFVVSSDAEALAQRLVTTFVAGLARRDDGVDAAVTPLESRAGGS